jgi:hypothetical protein
MLRAKTQGRTRSLLSGSAIAFLCAAAGVAAWAAKSAPAALPPLALVCINNACITKADSEISSIADAIARGRAGAVFALGGSGRQVLAAIRANPNYGPLQSSYDEMAANASVTVEAFNGVPTLVGSNGMRLFIPGVGRAPASAPIEAPPQNPPGATAETGPDGSRTIRLVPSAP